MNRQARRRGTLLALLWVCFWFTGCAPNQKAYFSRFSGTVVADPKSDPVVQTARGSVVIVEALDGRSQMLGFGTGFLVGESSVATCLHVVEAAARIRLVLPDGSRREVVGIRGTDPMNDLVVLECAGPLPGFRILELRSRPAVVGETVTAIATPAFLTTKATRGHVLAIPEITFGIHGRSILLSTPASPGFSGGPVLDSEGRVLGVSSEIRSNPLGSALVAVPSEALAPLVAKEPVSLQAWRDATLQPTPTAALLLARAEGISGTNPVGALALVERALGLSPHYARGWSRKAALLLRTGKPLLAEESLRRLESLLPGLEGVRIERCVSLVLGGRPVEARELAASLVKENPGKVLYHILEAETSWASRSPNAAIRASRAAIALRPEDSKLHDICGRFLLESGCLEGADREFVKSRELEPSNAQNWYLSGLSAWRQGRTNVAIDHFQQSLRLTNHPSPSVARYHLFIAHWGAGRRAEAQLEFHRFLESGILPQHPDVPAIAAQRRPKTPKLDARSWESPETHRRLASFLVEHRFEELLRPVLDVCVRQAPIDAELWVLLSIQAVAQWDFNRAREGAMRALAIRPNHSYAFWILGLCHFSNGDRNAARIHLEKAIRLDPGNRAALLALAELESKAGNTEAFEVLLKKARSVGGDPLPKDNILRQLPEPLDACP